MAGYLSLVPETLHADTPCLGATQQHDGDAIQANACCHHFATGRIHTRQGDHVLGALSINLTQSAAAASASHGQLAGQAHPATASTGLSDFGQTLHATFAALLPYSLIMAVGPSQVCQPVYLSM